ncbi:ribokinase [Pseudooceanicola sediminis]|uniref:Ribokinase n=1 Tax=Pseudooceanicola sediminis TaxID=2211117 RepID=A0A399J733_9RHOB|nr:ribokinase [Pseudooceanicola sediminis]KAA2315437.1 ribokinase [Puniceibacterium sp. HSS470]RII40357.1 ribokinase [Pseudooceanicola sediminis]|tara:strand:+ start:54744 stop:55601 length:858 start_codon:yes stop_codon:yes gene_type:complete
MAIWNLGSVNADLVYRVRHMPTPGETLSAYDHQKGLGGKGANMSVACHRAGSHVEHIGAVGEDGTWMKDRLATYGVKVGHLANLPGPSGQAVILLDDAGENEIIILDGANRDITEAMVDAALSRAKPGDTAIFQNETSVQDHFARAARAAGLRLAYAAAPFEAAAVAAVMEHLDILVMNAVEAEQLEAALGQPPEALPIADVVITLGGEGCRWINTATGTVRTFAAPKVTPVDTTGAGDTFTGYLIAGLDQGLAMEAALEMAQKAGALMVTRLGTADVIPTRDEL